MRTYVYRRVLRIVPVDYAMLAIVLLSLVPLADPPRDIGAILAHLLFLQDYTGATIIGLARLPAGPRG